MGLDGLCDSEGAKSASIPLERWVAGERGTKGEVSRAPSVS